MKIKIGKYVWNSRKCIPLQIIKYAIIGMVAYFIMLIIYYGLLPYSTLN